MNFHHLSLTRKLTIAFSILVAIIIGVSTLSVVSLSESQRDFDSFVSDEFSRGELGVLSLGNLLQQSAYGLVSRAGHSLSPAAEEWQRLLLEQDRALPAVADQ